MRIKSITFDCHNPFALATFWAQVGGFVEDADNPNQHGDPEGLLLAPGHALALLFVKVPEAKSVKNRVHLDLVPTDRSRDAEVARVTALGATLVGDHRKPDGSGWVVLADPEGNEFCVERGDEERRR